MSQLPRLASLASVPLRGREAEAKAEAAAEQLRNAWGVVVGPALVKHTRLLRLHRGQLVVGCWHPESLKALREAAQAAWPQVQRRIQRLVGVRVVAMDIVPCDPPEAGPAPEVEEDPFKAMLAKLRAQRAPRTGPQQA